MRKSLPDILDELGVQYARHGESKHVTEGWVGCVCCYCGAGTTNYGLGFPVNGFAANCWRCGSHKVLDALCKLSGKPPREVIPLLGGRQLAAVATTHAGKYKPPEPVVPLSDRSLAKAHRRYLNWERHIDPDEAGELWHLGGIRIHGRFPWHLFFPVYHRGEPVSWLVRTIGDKPGRRYTVAGKGEESVPAKRLLYGADLARHAVIVCEGPLDAIAIGPGAVSTLGVGFTAHQVAKLAKYPARYVCFDNEREAQKRARELAGMLEVFPGKTRIVKLDAKDPASADPEERRELRKLVET